MLVIIAKNFVISKEELFKEKKDFNNNNFLRDYSYFLLESAHKIKHSMRIWKIGIRLFDRI